MLRYQNSDNSLKSLKEMLFGLLTLNCFSQFLSVTETHRIFCCVMRRQEHIKTT